MSTKPEETMDKLMDRRKIVKVLEFRKSGSQWIASNYNFGDIESWQRNNPEIRILGTSVVAKEIPSYNTPPPPPPPPPAPVQSKSYEEIMYVSYEQYEEVNMMKGGEK